MKGGDADEFIDYLMDGGASVRHKGYVYHFSGFVYHPGQQRWRVSIEKYRWTKEPFEDFMELVYHYTSDEEEDCINHLTEDILWDGKSFYQLEKLSPGSTGKNLPAIIRQRHQRRCSHAVKELPRYARQCRCYINSINHTGLQKLNHVL